MGKESNVPVPDPKLIDAQVRSLGIQEDAIKRMLTLSEEQAPLIKQQMMDSIQRGNVLWAQSQEDREFALKKRGDLSRIQDRIMDQAASFNENDRRAELSGRSDADIAQTFAGVRAQMTRNNARSGVNPSDGVAGARDSALAIGEALGKVQGRAVAGDSARQQGLALTDRAHNALAGYPAMSAGSVGIGGSVAGMGQAAIAGGMANLTGVDQAVSGAAGRMGSQAGNMWGQQNQAYQNAQQMDVSGGQAAGSAVGSIIGLVAI